MAHVHVGNLSWPVAVDVLPVLLSLFRGNEPYDTLGSGPSRLGSPKADALSVIVEESPAGCHLGGHKELRQDLTDWPATRGSEPLV